MYNTNMNCPKCNTFNKYTVTDTRAKDQKILRRRICDECNYKFVTWEVFAYEKLGNQPLAIEIDAPKKKTPVKPKSKRKRKPLEKPKVKKQPKKRITKQQTKQIVSDINSIFEEVEQYTTTEDERSTIRDLLK